MATASSTSVVGPECTKHGITSSMLLQSSNLSEIKPITVTNGLILELARFKDKHRECTYKHLYGWMKDLFGTKRPEQAPNQKAVTQNIKRISAALSKLKTPSISLSPEREVNIEEYLNCEFVLPRLGFCRGRVVKFGVAKAKAPTKSEQQLQQQMYSITRTPTNV